MQLIAAAGTTVLVGCQRSGGSEEQQMSEEVVLGTVRLGMPWQTLDPFLFCVHHDDRYPAGNDKLGPQASLAGRQLGMDFAGKDGWRMYHGLVVPGFPQHPHRGFETVTVVRRGLLDHSDSLGAAARYGGGDVQWLTAGAGILHAEMFPLLDSKSPNPVELFQIWLNLPKVDKFAEPQFSMLWSQVVPRLVITDERGKNTELTVVAGKLGATDAPPPPPRSWASRADSDVAIWTIKMQPGARWTLPATDAGSNRVLYFFAGKGLKVGAKAIPASHAVQLRPELAAPLEAGDEEIEMLLLQGRPIGEPVVQHGPFVMNSREEIADAIADYQRTQFGGWPWEGDDPVHPRDETRFARHVGGRIERPT
jgi:quercetin 2,3-dioxygenase